MRLFFWLVLAALALEINPARAEVASAGAGGFLIQAETRVAATPDRVWNAVLGIRHWWGDAHTYSGDARNLSLDARAGGCWCERWGAGQSVEHMRVVMVREAAGGRTLRMTGGLGPLQGMGASGVMDIIVAPDANGARLTLTYRVFGESSLALDQIAPAVDGVIMEQFGRLARYSDR